MTLPACGEIGNVVLDGSAFVALADPAGNLVWLDQSPSGHVNETFEPSLGFDSDLTLSVAVGSRQHMRYFVYGNSVAC